MQLNPSGLTKSKQKQATSEGEGDWDLMKRRENKRREAVDPEKYLSSFQELLPRKYYNVCFVD